MDAIWTGVRITVVIPSPVNVDANVALQASNATNAWTSITTFQVAKITVIFTDFFFALFCLSIRYPKRQFDALHASEASLFGFFDNRY